MHALLVALALLPSPAVQDESGAEVFQPEDVFELEVAADPQLSPDGKLVVYVRTSYEIMTDQRFTQLWAVADDGSGHRPLTEGLVLPSAPRFSPDGARLAFVGTGRFGRELHVRWMETGVTARVTNLESSPSAPLWSPDGRWLAFTQQVEEPSEPFASLPAAPEGAKWAPAPKLITSVYYRRDGAGYVDPGHRQLFVVPSEGGTPRQLTDGPFDVRSPTWTPDGSQLVFSSNRREDSELEPNDSELYAVALDGGQLRQLTDRRGPDGSPAVSPDGAWIAYLGYDDRYQGYQVTQLHVQPIGGGEARVLASELDRDVASPTWSEDSSSIVASYADHGVTYVGRFDLDGGAPTVLARDVGGTSLGRPYDSGSFDLGREGQVLFTRTRPDRPADLVLAREPGVVPLQLTDLNSDLLQARSLATHQELEFTSSHDGRELQAWLALPPGYAEGSPVPLILEIHGGPFANYGPRFSAEVQLYAAAGYAVLYGNPRGSTSYGEEFGNLIHHAYPGHDYDDLMDAVDHVIASGVADPERLYVTGGSGGGVLTSWIVGKTDRFQAAVVAKPVINWTSFALTADIYPFVTKYWFPGPPWELPEEYFRRSPLSLVGNVSTPTMLLTGEEDHRTPIAESEQYYQALKLRGIDTALVRIPGASHGITSRPSRLFTKTAYILEWFARHEPE